ncbi:type IV secretory system conjugative DNA transfer family protein [Deinococcus proteolyticus]|uniref:type IV secretory system conjugative DNA transfer family protein n=1 Tax=Deinococcus proteolyticus TaxID=55148 RepID=UPI00031E1E5E|nr:type IV secretory system conjugative DNA transfer family protein [Deinococcus proteolyticus]
MLFLVIAGVIVALIPLWTTSVKVMGALAEAGWNTVVNPKYFAFACLNHLECTAAYNKALQANYPYIWLAPLVVSLIIYGLKAKPKEYVVKDPGMAWWAQAEDKGIEQYLSHGKGDNKLIGYLGHLMSVKRDGDIDYKKTIPLYVRQNDLAENVLVMGGVGAGKTRGYFRPLMMLAAHLGYTIIVIDMKFPQADSGFFDMVGYWKKKGRDVMLFTPFAENTMRLPLLESVTDYASALSMASTIMPPPEYGPEPGKHYRDRDRGVLAGFILAVAQSEHPSFGELLRYSRFTPQELKEWFELQRGINEESDVVQNLKGVFAQGDKEVASVLQGIKNALKIFYDPRVARATQGLEGENMDVRAAFRRPTMLYVGIQQEYMMEGDGVILLQLVKRYIDKQIMKEAEAQGGRFKRHVAYILDEFPAMGQLPYMMRSLGVLRSYNVSHHIGLQTLSQLSVVYGDDYSKALTTNVIGRKIFYPRAIDADERQVLSDYIGDTTVYEFSDTDSRRAFMGTQLDEATRSGVSMKKVARPLLPVEEFPHFRAMEAIISSRGVDPIRTFMPAIEDEFLEGQDIPRGIPNGLYALYKQVNPERVNMGKYTTQLLESGAFGIKVQQHIPDVEDRFCEQLQRWLKDPQIKFRRSGSNKERLYIEFIRERTEEEQQLVDGFYVQKYLSGRTGQSLRVSAEGEKLLPARLMDELEQAALLGQLNGWLEHHKEEIESTPEREALSEPPELQAIVRGDIVLLRFKICTSLFGQAPMSLMKRVGKAQYIEIDRSDPRRFMEVLAEAEENSSPLANPVDMEETHTAEAAVSAAPAPAAAIMPGAGWTGSAEDQELAEAVMMPASFADEDYEKEEEDQGELEAYVQREMDEQHLHG